MILRCVLFPDSRTVDRRGPRGGVVGGRRPPEVCGFPQSGADASAHLGGPAAPPLGSPHP